MLLLAGGELWAAGPFQPRGICSLSENGATPGIPEIPGRQALVQWSDCNPAPGVYDFTSLETQITNCMADGRKFCLIKLNGDNKPAWMTNVVPYLKGVQLAAEVKDPNTLMYWHPTFKQAYRDLIAAYGNWLSNYPNRAFIGAVRMNYDSIGTELTGVPAQYQAATNWTVPPGCTNGPDWTSSEALNYTAMSMDEHLAHIIPSGRPVYARCNLDDSIVLTNQSLFQTAVFGWFHTGAAMEQNQYFNQDWRYSRFTNHCLTGLSYGFTENVQYYSITNPPLSNYNKAQIGYWYFLSGMHCGVSCLGLYSPYLNDLYSDTNFPNWVWAWVDKYAGYHANPELAPGGWVALRGQGDNFPGDYSYLMKRLTPDTSTETNLVGGSPSIYSPWARSLPAGSRVGFTLNSGLFGGLPIQSSPPLLKIRVVYWDGGTGNWELRYDALGNTNKLAATVTKGNNNAWKELVIEIPDGHFGKGGPGGADVWVSNGTGSATIFHMVEVSYVPAGLSLNATEDTYANSGSAGASMEGSTNLRLNGNAAPKIIFLKFAVSGLTRAVQSATLRLFSQTVTGNVAAKQVTNNTWSAATLTWNNMPAYGAGIATNTSVTNAWCEWDVSSYVTNNGTYSIALVGTSGNQDFTSQEGGAAPRLILKQSVAPTNPVKLAWSAASSNLTLSWPSSYLGWSLQVQTNLLRSNWFTVPGSQARVTTNLPIVRTNRAMFYRLAY